MRFILSPFLFLFLFQAAYSQKPVAKEVSAIYDSLFINTTYENRERLNKRGIELSKPHINNPEIKVFYYKFLLNLGDLHIYYTGINDSILADYKQYCLELEKENFLQKDILLLDFELLVVYFHQERLEYEKAEVIMKRLLANVKGSLEKCKLFKNIAIVFLRRNKNEEALKYINKSIKCSKLTDDQILITNSYMLKGSILFKLKRYLDSYKVFDTALVVCKERNQTMKAIIYGHIAAIYNIMNDFDNAILYSKGAVSIIENSTKSPFFNSKFCLQVADIYMNNNKLDSCYSYVLKVNSNIENLNKEFLLKSNLYYHHCYVNEKPLFNYNSSIVFLNKASQYVEGARPERKSYYKAIINYFFAKANFQLKNYTLSNEYIDKCTRYDFEKEIDFNFFVSSKEIYELASIIKEKLGKVEQSVYYLQKVYEATQLIEKEKLEAEITKMDVKKELKNKKVQLDKEIKEKEANRNELIFIVLLSFFVLIFFIIYFLKLKTARINNKLLELNNKFTQTQIAPHFIANALSKIQSKIFEGKKKEASEMLEKFSELSDLLILSVKEKSISFQQELDLVEKYLFFQKQRKDVFNYEVEASEGIDKSKLIIPPLISQPFIENAIEHGLFKKNGDGFLKIKYTLYDSFFKIEIEDNGVGMSTEDLKKQQSYSYKIIEERLILFNQMFKGNHFLIDINSVKNKGTRVSIQVPYKQVS